MATVETNLVPFGATRLPEHIPGLTYVYRIVNSVNGRCYVGVTVNLATRRYKHIHEDGCRLLHRALKKHGQDVFGWEVVFEHEDDGFVRDVMESYFIGLFRSFRAAGGYNLTYGGDSSTYGPAHPCYGKSVSIETRKKMAEAKKGKPSPRKGVTLTDETIERMRHAKRGITGETRRRMSLAKLGKPSPKRGSTQGRHVRLKVSRTKTGGRDIVQICPVTKMPVATYVGMPDVLDVFPGKRTAISNCLNRRCETSCGFRWEYR